MTDKEALKLALEALKYHTAQTRPIHETNEAITALKAALEAKDEPVAWGVFEGNLHDMFFSQEEAQEMADLKGTHAEVRPFYTAPPQPEQEPVAWEQFYPDMGKPQIAFNPEVVGYVTPQTWVGLTDDDWNSTPYDTEFRAGAEWAEAKLKEKNT
jgi:hypothetical protein